MAKSTSVQLAYLSAILSLISVTLGILAFGTPYWIRYDGVIVVSISGTRSHVRMRFHYGFWRYCNDVSTSIQSLNNCGAVKTHTDMEQLTICLAMLAIVLSVNAFINTVLYLCLMKNEKMCLYVTTVSSIVSGLTMAAAVINYGIQSHATEITRSFTLPFSVANLSTSFWLSIADSIIISSTAVITIISLYYHTDKFTNYDVSLTSLEEANHTLDRDLQTDARYAETSDAVYNHIVYKPDTHHLTNEDPSDNCSIMDEDNEQQLQVDFEDRHPWNLDEDDNLQRETTNAKRKQNCKSQGETNDAKRKQDCKTEKIGKTIKAYMKRNDCQTLYNSWKPNACTNYIVDVINTENQKSSTKQSVNDVNDLTNDAHQRRDSLLGKPEAHLKCAVIETDQRSILRINHVSDPCFLTQRVNEDMCVSRTYNTFDTTKPISTSSEIVSHNSPKQSSFTERLRARRMARLQTARRVDLASVVVNVEPSVNDESSSFDKHSCKPPSELKDHEKRDCIYFVRKDTDTVVGADLVPHLNMCSNYTTDPINMTSIQPNTGHAVVNQKDNGSLTNEQGSKVSVNSTANVSNEKGIGNGKIIMHINTTYSSNKVTGVSNCMIENHVTPQRSPEECSFRCVSETDTSKDISLIPEMSNQTLKGALEKPYARHIISLPNVDLDKLQSEIKYTDNMCLSDKCGSIPIKQNMIQETPTIEKQELFRNLGKVHTESSAARIDTIAFISGYSPLRIKPNTCRQSPSPLRTKPKQSGTLTAREIDRVKKNV